MPRGNLNNSKCCIGCPVAVRFVAFLRRARVRTSRVDIPLLLPCLLLPPSDIHGSNSIAQLTVSIVTNETVTAEAAIFLSSPRCFSIAAARTSSCYACLYFTILKLAELSRDQPRDSPILILSLLLQSSDSEAANARHPEDQGRFWIGEGYGTSETWGVSVW